LHQGHWLENKGSEQIECFRFGPLDYHLPSSGPLVFISDLSMCLAVIVYH